MSAVTRTATFDAPLEEVWSALRNPAWLGASVEIDVRPGGIGHVDSRSVLVTEVDEGHRLSMLWWDENDEVSSVSLTVEATPEGTALTVVERNAAPTMRWGCAFAMLAATVAPARV
jgi:uncharacterized protein YndB with AHSA1/START domain